MGKINSTTLEQLHSIPLETFLPIEIQHNDKHYTSLTKDFKTCPNYKPCGQGFSLSNNQYIDYYARTINLQIDNTLVENVRVVDLINNDNQPCRAISIPHHVGDEKLGVSFVCIQQGLHKFDLNVQSLVLDAHGRSKNKLDDAQFFELNKPINMLFYAPDNHDLNIHSTKYNNHVYTKISNQDTLKIELFDEESQKLSQEQKIYSAGVNPDSKQIKDMLLVSARLEKAKPFDQTSQPLHLILSKSSFAKFSQVCETNQPRAIYSPSKKQVLSLSQLVNNLDSTSLKIRNLVVGACRGNQIQDIENLVVLDNSFVSENVYNYISNKVLENNHQTNTELNMFDDLSTPTSSVELK